MLYYSLKISSSCLLTGGANFNFVQISENKVQMSQRPIRRLLDVDDHEESDINMSLTASTSASVASPSVRRSNRILNSPSVNYKDSLRFVTIY